MANGPQIIIPRIHRAGADPLDLAAEEAARSGLIPIRIKCPECSRIYTLYIKDFAQSLHVFIGQACPFCKRFIKETDDPDDLLIDAKEIREIIKKENTHAGDSR